MEVLKGKPGSSQNLAPQQVEVWGSWACSGFDGEMKNVSAYKGLFRTPRHGTNTKANDNNVGELPVIDKVAA